jgi:hypothetical protein
MVEEEAREELLPLCRNDGREGGRGKRELGGRE